jgi:multiple sugar transport system ATP-binding protein
MAAVQLERVGKTYPGGVPAVRDVSLRVEDGELVVLMGPSGSGKTTLLRLIAGLERLTTGAIALGDRWVQDEPPHRRGVALVAQRPALYPHLSVADNLAFGHSLSQPLGRHWFGRGERRKVVEPVARLLGLQELLERRPAELSGGQQQRVSLGRALVRRAAVTLLDEPLASLDTGLRLEMRRELHLLQRQLHATMIYVTHDQDEALTLGDRVVLLDQGCIRQADRPSRLYETPATMRVAMLLGWPPMSFLPGTLRRSEERLVFSWGQADLAVPACCRDLWQSWRDRPVLLGLRPEHVRLQCGSRDATAEEVVVTLDIVRLEYLGAVSILTLGKGEEALTARHAGPCPSVGARVDVTLALPRAHLFDAGSGLALAHGPQPAAGV